MDKDNRSLLDCHSRDAEAEDYHHLGFVFLKSVSMSSLLATRYISVLRQLHGVHIDECSIHDSKDSTKSVYPEEIDSKQPSSLLDSHGNINKWDLEAPDLFSQMELDFSEIDDLFFGTGPLTDPFMGAAGNRFPSSYVGW